MKHLLSAIFCAVLTVTTPVIAAEWGDLDPPEDVPVQLPDGYDGNTPTPMLLLLHGYGPVGGVWSDDAVLGFARPAWNNGTLLVRPTGSNDGLCYYWNASDACCDFKDSAPDHVGYLLALVEHVQAMYNVDPRHIHVAGYSNGGFMAHRLGCEHPELFASVTSIAGMGPMSMESCAPTNALNVLQLHGTGDRAIGYGGGHVYGNRYPSAHQTAANWARHLGAAVEPVVVGKHSYFDQFVTDSVTTDTFYTPQSSTQGVVRTLNMQGSGHLLRLSNQAFAVLFDWFETHPSPTCDGDLTGDLRVDLEDLLSLLAAFGDAHGDTDVTILLGAWGDCD